MNGKTVVITGATSGIGEVAADRIAAKGARIVFIARDESRGEETLKHLKAIAPGQPHKAYYADLSRLSEMKRVGAEIAAQEARIDVLINNAGAAFMTREVTEDGLEKTFALNHMSYFVLTSLLRPKLGRGGRIVSTASTVCRPRSAMRALPSTAAPSSATSSSRASWRGSLPAPASPPTACIRASSPRASATTTAA